MRILHLLAERGYSGGEHQLEALLAHLKARGHESIVACQPGARFREVCERLELRVENLRMRNDLDVLAIAAIRKLYKRTSCDLIHWACSRSHKLGALAAARMKNRPPCVVTRRMDYPLPKTRLRRWLYGTAPDAVVAVSEGVRREVLALGVEPARVHLIHDGVDVERLCNLGARRSAAREAFGLDEGCVVGLTTASLHRRKGHDVLIAALGELASSLDEILASRGLTESQGGGDSRRSADRQAGRVGGQRVDSGRERERRCAGRSATGLALRGRGARARRARAGRARSPERDRLPSSRPGRCRDGAGGRRSLLPAFASRGSWCRAARGDRSRACPRSSRASVACPRRFETARVVGSSSPMTSRPWQRRCATP